MGGVVGLSGAALLAACGTVQTAAPAESKEEMAPKEAEKEAPAMEHTPVWAVWMGDETSQVRWNGAMELFAEDHPEVTWKITWEHWKRSLPPLLAAGEIPDIANTSSAPHILAEQWLDAGPIMAAGGIDPSNYPSRLFEAVTWRGKSMGVPTGSNTTAMFFRNDMFDEAGQNPPTDDMSWEEAIAIGADITSRINQGEDRTRWGISPFSYAWSYFPYLYAGMVDSDGNLNVNRDIAVHLTQLILKDSVEKFRAAPDRATLKELEDRYGNPTFPDGKIAMLPGGTFVIKPFRDADPFAFSTVQVPYTNVTGTQVRGAFNGHEQMSLLAGGAENPDAQVFAVWTAQEKHQLWMGAQGWAAPALFSAGETFAPPAEDPRPADQSAFVKAIEYATSFFPHPASNELYSAATAGIIQFVDEGTLTAEEAIDQGIAGMQVALETWEKDNS
jgi:ABC-type glycerol-3-phosphate transport system substrate-binding protein